MEEMPTMELYRHNKLNVVHGDHRGDDLRQGAGYQRGGGARHGAGHVHEADQRGEAAGKLDVLAGSVAKPQGHVGFSSLPDQVSMLARMLMVGC